LSSYAVQGAKRFSPFARSGDALIVWKPHWLARSMKQLIEKYRNSSGEGNWVSQLDRTSRHNDRAGKACSHMVDGRQQNSSAA
jgi:hypothetical protein